MTVGTMAIGPREADADADADADTDSKGGMK